MALVESIKKASQKIGMAMDDLATASEEKEARKMETLLKEYHLDELHDEGTKNEIAKLLDTLASASFGVYTDVNLREMEKANYLKALSEQNWIIIRQLDNIAEQLKKIDD